MSFTPNSAITVNNTRNLAARIAGAQGAERGRRIVMPEWLLSLGDKFPPTERNRDKAAALFHWLSEAQLQSVHGGYVVHLHSKSWKRMTEQFMLPKINLAEIGEALGGNVKLSA